MPMRFFSRATRQVPFLLAGAACVLGFAPFYLFFLPLLALAWLFARLRDASPRAAAVRGGVFGMGYFGAGVSWIYVSLHDYGGMAAPLAGLATLLFCAVLALFPALAAYGLARWRPRPGWGRIFAAAAWWGGLEWVRGWLFTGFPWLALGYSQVRVSPLAGFAPVFGIYGVTFAAALTAALLAEPRRHAGWMKYAALLVLWGAGAGCATVEWTHPVGAPVRVSLLQGNIPQEMKWREDSLDLSLATYRDLLQRASGRLTVLPETALPLFRHQLPASYEARLAGHGRRMGGDVIVGLPEYAADGAYFNSAFSFGASPAQTYRKYHLVPFGEYIPLRPILGWVTEVLKIPLADFSRGPKRAAPMQVAGQRVAVDICYEDVFGEEIIRSLPEATLLVNITNDAWFGDSTAPWQHLQMSQARALEAGRPLLRATNTGVTAIVDAHGRVAARAPLFTAWLLEGEVTGRRGATPYALFGNLPALALMALAWLWTGSQPAGRQGRQAA